MEEEVLLAAVGKEKCIKLFAAIVEGIVRFLLSQPATNPFIAMSVLEKTVVGPIQEGFKTETQEGQITKAETYSDNKATNSLN